MIALRSLPALAVAIALALGGPALAADRLTLESVNEAAFRPLPKESKDPLPHLVKLQVLLDRALVSPGEIDGRDGENTRKAIDAYARLEKLGGNGDPARDVFEALSREDGEPVLVRYRITDDDVRGPFVTEIPDKMEEQAGLDRLGYRSPREMLAERFHMSEGLLSALNPGTRFDEPGREIVVAAVSPFDPDRKPEIPAEADRVTRIAVTKGERRLYAYRADDSLAAIFPASIGSTEKPAPEGGATVTAVARNPTYTYDPKFAFKGVGADRKFTINPGPNNPVGAVWIDLDVPTYGIHGTPEPGKVGKSYSHGCIRLTNWDVERLARLVGKGTRVEFLD
ncbi:L,D-transpeptidase [Prosthecomicrobium sp. N25]|uniref:L,D-transpeptidase n=1 Tax=Prosthecomicrobium sp. N25 TaxID=3129254 RepID=UPI003077FEAE